jgi:hypothetical protein
MGKLMKNHVARIRKSKYWCTLQRCREATQPVRNALLLLCHHRLCRSATTSLATSHSVTPVSVQESLPTRHEDGLLPTVLFQRVFISGRDHYVVFNPK